MGGNKDYEKLDEKQSKNKRDERAKEFVEVLEGLTNFIPKEPKEFPVFMDEKNKKYTTFFSALIVKLKSFSKSTGISSLLPSKSRNYISNIIKMAENAQKFSSPDYTGSGGYPGQFGRLRDSILEASKFNETSLIKLKSVSSRASPVAALFAQMVL